VKRFDVTPYLNLGVFRELKDADYFKQVTLAFGTVQWPNEQDISPDTLYIEGVDIADANSSKHSAPELAEQTNNEFPSTPPQTRRITKIDRG
jgi:uncharacterized protein DUF2442